ncbi:MAG: hypothetical protein RIR26_1476 [Pseudomonadota bacterium]
MEQRLNHRLKNLMDILQQRFDLANATLPPFSVFVLWSGIGAGALLLSAVANALLAKYVLFPQLNLSKTVTEDTSNPALVVVVERPKSDDFKEILKRNLFNSEQMEEVAKDTKSQTGCTPVKTELPLKFTGLIYGGSKETSLVLLESTATRQADTFILNDVIPGDAKIIDIQRDKVLILRGSTGCPEFLNLQQPEPLKRRVPNLARSRAASPQINAGSGVYEFSEAGFTRSRGGQIVADRRWVDKALTSDFAKTLQDAKASPNLVDGQVKGFILTRIRPDSVYEKMGFQDGDVVEQINGIDLNDAARAIQTLNSLKNENAIDLMVKRNGVAMPLKIQVK